MAGLEPAIQTQKMDGRVEPAHGEISSVRGMMEAMHAISRRADLA